MSEPNVPEGGQLSIPLPLTAAAKVVDRDRVVNVELTRKPSDSRTQVTLQQGVFHAGRTNDTLYVGLTNSSHLDQVYDTIQVHILSGEDFDQGLKSNLYATVCLHNGYPRPEWWTSRAENVLGYFSQLKMKVFIAVTGGTDAPRSDKSSSSGHRQTSHCNTGYICSMTMSPRTTSFIQTTIPTHRDRLPPLTSNHGKLLNSQL